MESYKKDQLHLTNKRLVKIGVNNYRGHSRNIEIIDRGYWLIGVKVAIIACIVGREHSCLI